MDAPPVLVAAFVAIGFVGFLVSTVFGVGASMIIAPALMFVLPAGEAVSMMAPVMLFNNGFKAFAFRGHIAWRAAGATLITAAPCAVGGALLVGVVDEKIIKLGIVLLIVSALLSTYLLRRTWRFSLLGLVAAGAPIGFISGICSAAGSPTAVAYRGHGLVKERFVGTVAILAIGMQLTKIPTYVVGGTLRAEHAPLGAALVVASLVAVVLGRRLVRRFDAQRFRSALDLVLLLIAAALLVDVVSSI